jgi:anti-sigma factor RsiW
MKCDEAQELLEAYHDGELTAETRSTLAAHLRICADCPAALAQLDALSGAIKTVGAYPVPERLRRNVQKLADDAVRARVVPPRRWRFALLAASHIGVALAGGLLAYMLLAERNARTFDIQETVTAHVRSLMDNQLVQVASSDMHTVRPWFAGKIDFSPDVRDFATAGFPLVGGRVDYVGTAKVAALVYTHNKHIINVFVSPAGALDLAIPRQSSRSGYTIIEWQKQDLHYRAVSDLNPVELAEFVKALKSDQAL